MPLKSFGNNPSLRIGRALFVLVAALCLYSAVFAVQRPTETPDFPADSSQKNGESMEVTIIVDDPRPRTQPASQPASQPAKIPTVESIITEELEKSVAATTSQPAIPATKPAEVTPAAKAPPAPKPTVAEAEKETTDLLGPAPKTEIKEAKTKSVERPVPPVKPAAEDKPTVPADEPDFGPVVSTSQPATMQAEPVVKTVELEVAPAAEAPAEDVPTEETPTEETLQEVPAEAVVEEITVQEISVPQEAEPVVTESQEVPTEPEEPVTAEKTMELEKKVEAPVKTPEPVKSPQPEAKKETTPAVKSATTQPTLKGMKVPAPTEPDPVMTTQADADELGLTTKEMQELVMKLQMYNSELMDELQKGRMQNYKLIRALRESRKNASDLQIKLTRKEIEFNLKKLQAQQDESLKNGKEPTTVEELQRENRIMLLKLQLLEIDQPKRYATMLEKVAELSTEKEKVWANYRKANELLSKQANIAEQRQEEINVIRPKLQEAEKEIARLRMEVKQLKASLTNPAPEATPPPIVAAPQPAANTTPASMAAPARKSVTSELVESRLVGKIISLDDQIIKINIGSLKGLQTGMRLIVYRRDKFVGYMRVDIVGETTAAGSMSREILVPQVGDSVTDRL